MDRPHLSSTQRIALASVVAAVLLVLMKLLAGLASGSLGLLAEAAHSGTDLVAALLSFWALGIAARPPDSKHPYGHGKAEHLAALAEASFLAVVSAFIGYQAVHRLASPALHEVDPAWYTLAVAGVVLVIDLSRATLSLRAARRLNSAALGANALHFASDFVGTLAVLVGLAFARAGHPEADAIAGLVVAVAVIFAAALLIRTNVRVLMDQAPEGIEDRVAEAVGTAEPGARISRLRVRHAGGRNFVEATLNIAADAAVGQGDAVAAHAEAAIREALPDTDVTIRVAAGHGDDLRERATGAVLSVKGVREVHNVRLVELDGRTHMTLHVKLPPALTLRAAHAVSEELVSTVKASVPEIDTVRVHLEPLSQPSTAVPLSGEERDHYAVPLNALAEKLTGRPITALSLHREARGLVINMTVRLDPAQTLAEAHRAADGLEDTVRSIYPDVAEVVVQTEPAA